MRLQVLRAGRRLHSGPGSGRAPAVALRGLHRDLQRRRRARAEGPAQGHGGARGDARAAAV